MPQLDFREALSTPEEKLFSPAAAVPVPSIAPADTERDFLTRGVRLSRSAWTNITFVAIASVGGLVCAFYFFNGADVLRAAAAWPNEFLYPRPVLTDKIDIGEQLNPVDKFSESSKDTAASKKSDPQGPFEQSFWASDLTQPLTESLTQLATTPEATIPAPPFVLPGSSGTFVFVPLPSSPLSDLNTLVGGADALVQTLNGTVNQTLTSILPKTTPPTAAGSTITSTRRKLSSTRQKLPVRTSVNSSTVSSLSQTAQQMTATQVQTPVIQNQTMFGGGMGGVSVGGAGGSGVSVGGVGGVSGVGGVVGGVGGVSGGVGGVGGVVGGVGGLGGGLGGLGGGLGGIGGGLGGHH